MTTSGQICKMSYTAYCNTYCNICEPYCNILQYAFCRIVSPLPSSTETPYIPEYLSFCCDTSEIMLKLA